MLQEPLEKLRRSVFEQRDTRRLHAQLLQDNKLQPPDVNKDYMSQRLNQPFSVEMPVWSCLFLSVNEWKNWRSEHTWW